MLNIEQIWLIFWLVVWVAVVSLVIRSQWSHRLPSVGLPLIYLLSLSMIHWFGALIYTFPWYKPTAAYLISQGSSITNASTGFYESAYGVVGFGLGAVVLAPWVLKTLKPKWLYEYPREPYFKLPKTYITFGLFFSFVLSPILSRIPGFAAVSTSSISIFVVGLCLMCWQTWSMNNNQAFIRWLVVACSMPFITVLTVGFISFGAAVTVVVLVFVFNFYRPRWQLVLISLLVLLLGLSVFVTYARDRTEIRATVWGGKSSEARIERLWKTAQNFEIFDPHKLKHLEAIDIRLNQNILVGRAVKYISKGYAKYAYGETLQDAAIAVVPRVLWPDKPVKAGSQNLVSDYTGLIFARGTSVGVGQVLEFYINFGSSGVFFGFMIYGVVLRVIDITAGQKLIHGNWVGFSSWFLPGLGLIQPGGSLVEVTSAIAGSVVLIYCINKFYLPKKSWGKPLPVKPYSD